MSELEERPALTPVESDLKELATKHLVAGKPSCFSDFEREAAPIMKEHTPDLIWGIALNAAFTAAMYDLYVGGGKRPGVEGLKRGRKPRRSKGGRR